MFLSVSLICLVAFLFRLSSVRLELLTLVCFILLVGQFYNSGCNYISFSEFTAVTIIQPSHFSVITPNAHHINFLSVYIRT